ncbi:MAG: helicase-associated domain-containing protein [Ardenticatenales bacterium]|nr:helicase-associated domain-containing protein [Ardenticatenales bacterium]
MRSLSQALADHELIVLRVIGEWWEMDLSGADKGACVPALTQALAQLDLQEEISYLPPEEAEALQALAQQGGRIPVSIYSRKFGEVRQMGPGRMEQEEPWLDPVSPAEGLWYRGFLYRGFDKTADGMVEFFYLPDELYRQLGLTPAPSPPPARAPIRVSEPRPTLASLDVLPPPTAPAAPVAAPVDAVDDLTTILAAAQTIPLQEDNLDRLDYLLLNSDARRRGLLLTLAWDMKMLRQTDNGFKPTRAGVTWLQKGREAQLRDLAEAWSGSSWNELRYTPGLVCEGSGWENDALLARTALLDGLPRDVGWLRLADVIAGIKEHTPDFQRLDGNYDTWYIRDVATNQFLTGFDSWDLVEGRLLAFLITGPLHWLGLCDLDAAGELFRPTERMLAWLRLAPPPTAADGGAPLLVMPEGTLLVPQNASRYERFQVARVAEAQPVAGPDRPYLYRLTPVSLQEAQNQGIMPARVLEFLTQVSGQDLPPGLRRAVERWGEQGTEARLQHVTILRVSQPAILDKLRANPKTQPYLGESLGDLAVVVTDWRKLQQMTTQLGLLLEVAESGQP